jgi:hypothetical protein
MCVMIFDNRTSAQIQYGNYFTLDKSSIAVVNGICQMQDYQSALYYNRFEFETRVAVFNIPAQLNWKLIKAPLDKYKADHLSIELSKNILDDYFSCKIIESKNLSNNIYDLKSLNRELNDVKYLQKVSEAKTTLIKLQNDTLLRTSLSIDSIAKLNSIVQGYDNLNRKWNEAIKGVTKCPDDDSSVILDTISKKPLAYDQKKSNYQNDSLKLINEKLSGFQKVLSYIDRLSLGYHVLSVSNISLFNYSLTGVTLEYGTKKILYGFSAGKHERFDFINTSNVLYASRAYSKLNDKQSLYQANLGYRDSISETRFSFSLFTPDNTKSEWDNKSSNTYKLIHLASKRTITKNSLFVGEVSTPVTNEKSFEQMNSETIAYSISSKNNIKDLNLSFDLGYNHIGHDFYTPGNIYLISGQNSIDLSVLKSLLKGSLQINPMYTYYWSGSTVRKNIRINLKSNISKNTILTHTFISNTTLYDDVRQRNSSALFGIAQKISESLTASASLTYGVNQYLPINISHDLISNVSITYRRSSSVCQFGFNSFSRTLQVGTISSQGVQLGYQFHRSSGLTLGGNSNIQFSNQSVTINYRLFGSYQMLKRINCGLMYNSMTMYSSFDKIWRSANFQLELNLSYNI